MFVCVHVMLMAAHSMDADHCILPALHSAPLSQVHTPITRAHHSVSADVSLTRVYRSSIAHARAG